MASWMKKTGMLFPTMSVGVSNEHDRTTPATAHTKISLVGITDQLVSSRQLSRENWHTHNLVAKPWTSRAVSALPLDPATVENLTNTGVSFPASPRNDAAVMLLKSP